MISVGARQERMERQATSPVRCSVMLSTVELCVVGLLQHGACVNVADLWKFTPLHEAASKGKFEICKLLLKVRMSLHQTAGFMYMCIFVILH